MKRILVIAPHPDDETLGCGGTLMRHIENEDLVSWLIVTGISVEHGFSSERVSSRANEIDTVSSLYGFNKTYQLNWPTMKLDTIPMHELVSSIAQVISEVCPEVIYIPHRGDIHTDHKYVFDAAVACTKWFRYPSVKKVLVYETLSETEFGISSGDTGFRPNVYVNVEPFSEKKCEIMKVYASELGVFPFPRSLESIDALSRYRGSSSGFRAAEAFMLLKEVIE